MDEFVILITVFLLIICVCIFSKRCNREGNTDSVYLNVVDRNRSNSSEIVDSNIEIGNNSSDSDNIPDISLNNLNSLLRDNIIDIIDSNSNCYKCKERSTDCIICLENIEEGNTIRNLRCMHKFHKECLEKSMEFIDCCPLCRSPFENKIREPMTREQLIEFILERLQEIDSSDSE